MNKLPHPQFSKNKDSSYNGNSVTGEIIEQLSNTWLIADFFYRHIMNPIIGDS
jgi:hypothetical protein